VQGGCVFAGGSRADWTRIALDWAKPRSGLGGLGGPPSQGGNRSLIVQDNKKKPKQWGVAYRIQAYAINRVLEDLLEYPVCCLGSENACFKPLIGGVDSGILPSVLEFRLAGVSLTATRAPLRVGFIIPPW
jgi:hypothetical protein